MVNYLLHHRPSGYAFHVTPVDKFVATLPQLSAMHPQALFSSLPLFTQGANEGHLQGVTAMMSAHCHGRYPEFNWTVADSVSAILRSRTWGSAGMCSPWHRGTDREDCITRYLNMTRAAIPLGSPRDRALGLRACEKVIRLFSSRANENESFTLHDRDLRFKVLRPVVHCGTRLDSTLVFPWGCNNASTR